MLLPLEGVKIGVRGGKKSYMLKWLEPLQRVTLHNQIYNTPVELNVLGEEEKQLGKRCLERVVGEGAAIMTKD